MISAPQILHGYEYQSGVVEVLRGQVPTGISSCQTLSKCRTGRWLYGGSWREMSPPPDSSLLRLTKWSDERLCAACLHGDEEAWDALLEKYKRLIYSIPIRYGFSRDDAADIFQQVCLQLLTELPKLRTPKSLAGWLITVTSHACSKWAGREQRFQPLDGEEPGQNQGLVSSEMPDTSLKEIERAQILREALTDIPPRCRELMRMLFFQTPPVPYEEVAKTLGVAKGSIGFIRMRCLSRLRRQLEPKWFP